MVLSARLFLKNKPYCLVRYKPNRSERFIGNLLAMGIGYPPLIEFHVNGDHEKIDHRVQSMIEKFNPQFLIADDAIFSGAQVNSTISALRKCNITGDQIFVGSIGISFEGLAKLIHRVGYLMATYQITNWRDEFDDNEIRLLGDIFANGNVKELDFQVFSPIDALPGTRKFTFMHYKLPDNLSNIVTRLQIVNMSNIGEIRSGKIDHLTPHEDPDYNELLKIFKGKFQFPYDLDSRIKVAISHVRQLYGDIAAEQLSKEIERFNFDELDIELPISYDDPLIIDFCCNRRYLGNIEIGSDTLLVRTGHSDNQSNEWIEDSSVNINY